jgi:signal transduction histidine kinase
MPQLAPNTVKDDRQAQAYGVARLELAKTRLVGDHALSRALAHATKIAADTLEVERVGVWMLVSGGSELQCIHQYVRSLERNSAGETLVCADFPAYIRALTEHRAIVADDARTHPDTRELNQYLVEHGIFSMLDAPIFRDGLVFGVVCHEHVGPARHWTQRELTFAYSMADLVALFFETAARLRAEQAERETDALRLSAEKNDALRLMAGGIAHDVNNELSAINAAAFLAAENAKDPQLGWLRSIQDGVRRVTQLTRALLDYSAAPAAPTETEVGTVIRRLEPALRAPLRPGITLHLEAPREPAFVCLSPGDLERVFMNIARNASEAIVDKGKISIEWSAEDSITTIVIRDDGSGMDAETKAHAFDPFFTTKRARGERVGTGLGLAVTAAIVSKAGGTISVDSEPGRGSTFRVRLPRPSRSEPS